MKKVFLFLILSFFFSSCAHNKQVLLNQTKNNNSNEIEIKNFKTFLKIPASYNLNSNFKSKKLYFDDLNLLTGGNLIAGPDLYGLFGLSDALICDFRRQKMNQDFKKTHSIIKKKALIAFEEKDNLFKKYEFEIFHEYKNIVIKGEFLITKIFKNQNNELCKNFKYILSEGQKSIYHGVACKKKDFWNVEYIL